MRVEVEWLLARLNELEAWKIPSGLANEPSPATAERWKNEDIRHLALAVAAFVRQLVGLDKLEKRFQDQANLDVEALRNGYELLRDAKYEFTFASGKAFDPARRLQNIDTLIKRLTDASRLNALEVGLRISFAGDMPIDSLLMAATDLDGVASRLEPLVSAKLALLSDEQVLELVGQYLRDSDPAHDEPLPVPEEVRAGLAAVRDTKDARQKIAKYVLRDHPLAMRRTLETRTFATVPALQVGVARILTLQAGADPSPLTTGEQTVLRNVPRLAVAWHLLVDTSLDELAQGFRLQRDSLLLSGRAYDLAARGPTFAEEAPVLDLSAMWHVLRELIAGAKSHADDEPRSVQALWSYTCPRTERASVRPRWIFVRKTHLGHSSSRRK
jgi:hypothetical protein